MYSKMGIYHKMTHVKILPEDKKVISTISKMAHVKIHKDKKVISSLSKMVRVNIPVNKQVISSLSKLSIAFASCFVLIISFVVVLSYYSQHDSDNGSGTSGKYTAWLYF